MAYFNNYLLIVYYRERVGKKASNNMKPNKPLNLEYILGQL